MNYIVFDLEWNQPANEAATVKTPVYLTGEIIEIGAVKLDEAFRPTDELRLYILPQYYTKMHKRIAALTGIRDKALAAEGIPFPEAYAKFIAWCGSPCAFMTWSMNDVPMLIDNMRLHGIDASELPECYDIQRIFSREILRTDTRSSLDAALALLKEKGDPAHDALHDARNTVKICNHLDLAEYLCEYASKVFLLPPDEKTYANRADVLSDPALTTYRCPWCGAAVQCEPWVLQENNTYIAYGLCPEEDEFLLRLTLCKHPPKEYHVKRLLFEMSDDLWDIYMDKKETRPPT